MGWRLYSEIRSLGKQGGLPHDPSFRPGSSGELGSRSTAEVLGPAQRTGHSLTQQTPPEPPLRADTVLRAKIARGQGKQKLCWREENWVIPEAKWAQEDLSEGVTCDLRPAGGGNGILASGKSKDKGPEAGMSLHVLKEPEGGNGARAACAGGGQGHPSVLFLTHQQQGQSTPQKWLLEETLSHPALLQETEALGRKAAS